MIQCLGVFMHLMLFVYQKMFDEQKKKNFFFFFAVLFVASMIVFRSFNNYHYIYTHTDRYQRFVRYMCYAFRTIDDNALRLELRKKKTSIGRTNETSSDYDCCI